MRKTVEKQIGPFKTLTIEGQLNGPCVVLLHGYGADYSDLVPLAEMMNLSKDITWVFPQAPQQIIIGPGFHGRAWFQIDSKRLENAMINGEPADLSLTIPPGLEEASTGVAKFYKALSMAHNKIILGGFSQGAMLATDFVLRSDSKPKALVIMSGSLLNLEVWKKNIQSCVGMPFIQSHGKNDVLLGYEHAEKLHSFLTDNGMFGDFLAFNGGHEIPPKIIERIGSFISHQFR